VLPVALTLQTVHHPGRLVMTSDNPTPLGYTVSLLLFLVPMAVLAWWLRRRRDLGLQRQACVRTLALLVPLGVGLDLVFGNAFFTFPNRGATLGIGRLWWVARFRWRNSSSISVASSWCCSSM
jgi:hypothetical protein